MTKISQLSSIGDSLAIGDQFLIRDIDDTGSPNKSVTVSGITRALDVGTALAPAIAFASDKNTGIYSPGADQLAVATNGTGRLFIDASGNVGVGTASPNASSKLHVADGDVLISKTSGYTSLSFNFIGVGTARAASIKKNYDSPFELRIQGGNNDSAAPICFDRADGFENARFDGSGRLGIGTSAPAATLDIANGAFQSVRTYLSSITDTYHQFRGTPDGSGYEHARIFSGRDTSVHTYGSYLAFYTEGKSSGTTDTSVERLRIDSSGRVGIGTTSPSSVLDVVSAATGVAEFNGPANATVSFTATSFAEGKIQCGGEFTIGSTNNFPTAFITNGTERARIDSSGRLLVGTSSDSGGALLQVNGDRIRVGTAKTPASASDTGTTGEIAWDANYIYVCTATNTWKRSAIATW